MSFTPMIRQYLEIKKQYPDAILFFRLGDFYEMFFDDAGLPGTRITLTGRKGCKRVLCAVSPITLRYLYRQAHCQKYRVAICERWKIPLWQKGLSEGK